MYTPVMLCIFFFTKQGDLKQILYQCIEVPQLLKAVYNYLHLFS